jgi:hypothetical protein
MRRGERKDVVSDRPTVVCQTGALNALWRDPLNSKPGPFFTCIRTSVQTHNMNTPEAGQSVPCIRYSRIANSVVAAIVMTDRRIVC